MLVISAVLLAAAGGCDDAESRCDPACASGDFCADGTCVPAVAHLEFFFTNDEHGFIDETILDDGQTISGGAAHLMSLLRADGYDPDGDDTLLLSTGDTWDGALISWISSGAAMVEVMNLMGYAATAMGNHEVTGSAPAFAARIAQGCALAPRPGRIISCRPHTFSCPPPHPAVTLDARDLKESAP